MFILKGCSGTEVGFNWAVAALKIDKAENCDANRGAKSIVEMYE